MPCSTSPGQDDPLQLGLLQLVLVLFTVQESLLLYLQYENDGTQPCPRQ